VLTLADLQSADAIFLGNSVRGLAAATRIAG
jgi:branched-subunit amino acid aminotransferase/4-amino-4-deoxychorismate lyase